MDYKQVSQTEWQWQQGAKTYAVRVFPSLGTLIWSARALEGIAFDDGIRQQIAMFMANGAPEGITLPDALLNELREFLAAPSKIPEESGLFGGLRDWLRGRRNA